MFDCQTVLMSPKITLFVYTYIKRGKIKFEILILNLSCHDVVSNPLHATKLMIADKLFHQLSYCTCIIC